MTLAQFNKALMALIAGALAWGAQVVASTSGPVTAPEWLALAGIGAAAFGVYAIPNSPPPQVGRPPLEGAP